jgi:hypothetical protein
MFVFNNWYLNQNKDLILRRIKHLEEAKLSYSDMYNKLGLFLGYDEPEIISTLLKEIMRVEPKGIELFHHLINFLESINTQSSLLLEFNWGIVSNQQVLKNVVKKEILPLFSNARDKSELLLFLKNMEETVDEGGNPFVFTTSLEEKFPTPISPPILQSVLHKLVEKESLFSSNYTYEMDKCLQIFRKSAIEKKGIPQIRKILVLGGESLFNYIENNSFEQPFAEYISAFSNALVPFLNEYITPNTLEELVDAMFEFGINGVTALATNIQELKQGLNEVYELLSLRNQIEREGVKSLEALAKVVSDEINIGLAYYVEDMDEYLKVIETAKKMLEMGEDPAAFIHNYIFSHYLS